MLFIGHRDIFESLEESTLLNTWAGKRWAKINQYLGSRSNAIHGEIGAHLQRPRSDGGAL